MKVHYFIPFFLLIACGSEPSEEEAEDGSDVVSADTTQVDSLVAEEIALPPIDPENEYTANILQCTQYHSDEVMEDVGELEWMGLFADPDGHSSLRMVSIEAERIQDDFLDGDGGKTAWDISTSEDKDPLLLINGLDFLVEGSVYTLQQSPITLMPGEELVDDETGIWHRFYAEGKVESFEDYGEVVTEYSLFLEIETEDGFINQKILEGDSFDDTMIQILFIGDIDGDGILDLIADNTYHYNVMLPTLYLSRPADEGQILKKVAEHQSVGC